MQNTEAVKFVLHHSPQCDFPQKTCDCGVRERDEERDRMMGEIDTLRVEMADQRERHAVDAAGLRSAVKREQELAAAVRERLAVALALEQRHALEVASLKEELSLQKIRATDLTENRTEWRRRALEHAEGEAHALHKLKGAEAQCAQAITDREKMREQLDSPELQDFLAGVRLEAAHQRKRWGTDQDAGKTDADWFWLVGYLAGKAMHKPEKRLHHLITAAAALFNWHFYTLGKTNMRPGINPEVAP